MGEYTLQCRNADISVWDSSTAKIFSLPIPSLPHPNVGPFRGYVSLSYTVNMKDQVRAS